MNHIALEILNSPRNIMFVLIGAMIIGAISAWWDERHL